MENACILNEPFYYAEMKIIGNKMKLRPNFKRSVKFPSYKILGKENESNLWYNNISAVYKHLGIIILEDINKAVSLTPMHIIKLVGKLPISQYCKCCYSGWHNFSKQQISF